MASTCVFDCVFAVYLLAARKHVYFSHSAYLPRPLRARSALRGARGAVAMAFQTCFSQLLLTWHFKLASHTRRVLSPELQECMDRTKGQRCYGRWGAQTAEEQAAKPPTFWAESRGRTSATIRCEQSTKGGGAIAEVHENHGGHRRRPVIAHSHTRSLRTLAAQAHSKTKPTDHPNSHREDIPSVWYGARGPGQ